MKMLKVAAQLLAECLQDLRYAIRMLWKRPGFTLIATLTIALGIGASTAIFSAVNATLLRPLPYQDSDHLLMVWGTNPGGFGWRGKSGFSAPSFLDYQKQNQTFERMAVFNSTDFTLVGNESSERIRAGMAGDGFFAVLRVQPIIGRNIAPEDCQAGHDHVVVLSYGLWQQHFGSDANIVGQTVQLDTTPYLVIGVLPQRFDFSIPEYFEAKGLWVPLVLPTENLDRGHKYLSVIARLKPAVTLGQAEQDMKLITERLAQEYPQEMATFGVKLVSLQEQLVGDVRRPLLLLFGAVSFVLLIACANVANLQLARASTRQKELAIRRALGASRERLLRTVLTESLLLSLLGGVLGLLMAFWGMRLITALGPAAIPQGMAATLDARVLAYCLLLSLSTGILSGLAPALQLTSTRYDESLKEGARNSASRAGGLRLRKILTVAEVALSVMLLIGAGLLIRSFVALLRVNPGFNSQNILTARVYLPKYSYPDPAKQIAFYTQVIERIKHVPGAISVATTDELPPTKGSHTSSFSIAGHDQIDISNQSLAVEHRLVSSDYFRAMGIPVRSGRAFRESDDASALPVALVNESFARRFLPNENAIGQRLRFDSDTWINVVGIVGDVHGYGLDKAAKSEIYLPYQQQRFLSYNPLPRMYLVVHTSGDAAAFSKLMLDSIRQIDTGVPTSQTRTMETVLVASIAERRSNMLLLGIFALVALILTAVGIYGVISYAVAQRTQEIGIRMALGAQSRNVLQLVIGQGLRLVLIGLCLGLFSALALTRVLSTLLFGVGTKDPVTFVAVAVLLSTVALIACYVPARRATRVDPLLALRCE
ncbi:MAG TPA: ABC transporter permease [Pyrinomonadaceae bacterium]|nr:ABC transporter permease [Pyrinomonadaceae bacterium]